MKKPLLNLKNSEVGNVDLDKSIFGLKTFPDLIHQYIRYQNAKSRQGSHKTKTRSEVSGRSKKPFSQKELIKFVQETLGDSYNVIKVPDRYKISGSNVLIKRNLSNDVNV